MTTEPAKEFEVGRSGRVCIDSRKGDVDIGGKGVCSAAFGNGRRGYHYIIEPLAKTLYKGGESRRRYDVGRGAFG